MRKMLLATVLLTLLTSAQAQDDISRANGNIHVTAERPVGNVSGTNGNVELDDGVQAADVKTVNGGVRIGRNAVIGTIRSVNGGIRVDDGTRAQSIDTTNGTVRLGKRVQIAGKVNTVNGGVHLAADAVVNGSITTANGPIDLDRATVGGDVRTKSGDIEIGEQSIVKGSLVVEEGKEGWFSTPRTPLIKIGPGAVVSGTLTFKREVRLDVDPTAKIGAIEGVKPIRVGAARSSNLEVDK